MTQTSTRTSVYPIRAIAPEEFRAYNMAAGTAFGRQPEEEETEVERQFFEFDRSLAAFDGEAIVGTAVAFTFELTVPGGISIPAAGVSWVTVLPTHRRKGILRSMMQRQLEDVRNRGEAVALLYASESIIYGRFGYGAAASHLSISIDPRHGEFAGEREPAGTLRLIDRDAAAKLLPDVYERARMQRPGGISRNQPMWTMTLYDPEKWRDGASARFYVVYEGPGGDIEGYAFYRRRSKWEHGIPQSTLRVTELVTATPEAYAGLWRYLLGVDLITTVEFHVRPPDEPMRWMLADPRRLRMTDLMDNLWARIVDIPAALSARRYGDSGRLVLHIEDRFCPDNTGAYELSGGPDGAECRRTNAAPDLELGVSDLGATYLGGVSFSTLARAGRVRENQPGSLRRADVMFLSDLAPIGTQEF